MAQDRDLDELKGSQSIRIRPSVVLGSDGIRGVQQTLFEIVTNAIDRWKDGYGDKVEIIRHKDNSYTIKDFADGLPCSWNEKSQAFNWDLALCTLNSGDNYKQSNSLTGKLGNFGLGLTSSQFSSEYMNVIIRKEKVKYTLKFKEGRVVNKETGEFIKEDDNRHCTKEENELVLLQEVNNDGYTGTEINYKPDLRVFTDINIDTNWIQTKLKRQAMINNGISLEFTDELNDLKITYEYDNKTEYIKDLINDNYISDFISFNGEGEGKDRKDLPTYLMDYSLDLVFNNDNSIQEYYHNSSELTELNNNVTTSAFTKSITKAIHNYITENKLYKAKEKIKYSDIEDSIDFILCTRSTRTSYANQTKLSIDNEFIKNFISKDIEDKLYLYLNENKFDSERIINQLLINMRANNNAEKTKANIKSKLMGTQKGGKLKVEGLRDADMKHSELWERIFLVDEGISANSTIVDSFDNRIMGSLGLRGRFINSLKKSCSINDLLNNAPALGIIQAMGCGVEIPKKDLKKYNNINTFDINNLRYGSIGLLCDADAFGYGISLSILTFLYKFMPTIVKEGRVYLVISPRFEIIDKKKNKYYVYNETEKQLKIEELGSENVYSIGIKKGLGEFNQDEFWDYVLSPEARKKSFIKIKYDENMEDQIKYYFDMFMGDDIENRKKYIRENIVNIDLNTIE